MITTIIATILMVIMITKIVREGAMIMITTITRKAVKIVMITTIIAKTKKQTKDRKTCIDHDGDDRSGNKEW